MARIFGIIFFIVLLCFGACRKETTRFGKTDEGLLQNLSDYGIFQGPMSELDPSPGFVPYDISTPLFTDYSEKQRLVKLPAGGLLGPAGDGLPHFPEGTMLVKTFYYYKDKRDLSSEKKILETRILLLKNSKWSAGTYVWNDAQTEATLFTAGLNKTVNWIDEQGKAKVISYRIPDKKACLTCHQRDNTVLPLGPKMRNLNIMVKRNNSLINQLNYFEDSGIMNFVDPSSFAMLPDWSDPSASLEARSRAYLDVNCAHCHNSKGFASGSNLYMNYELPLEETRIRQKMQGILEEMEKERMPKIGTTVLDEEGLALLKKYLATMN